MFGWVCELAGPKKDGLYDIQVMTGGREPKQCGGSMGVECEDRRFYRNIKCSTPPEWRGGLIAFPVAS